jgi:hypothetical protein
MLPPNSNGKLDVGGGVGKGTLYVVRSKQLPGDPGPSPYSSITEIRSGEVSTREGAVQQKLPPKLTIKMSLSFNVHVIHVDKSFFAVIFVVIFFFFFFFFCVPPLLFASLSVCAWGLSDPRGYQLLFSGVRAEGGSARSGVHHHTQISE